MRYRYEITKRSAIEADHDSFREAERLRQALVENHFKQSLNGDGVVSYDAETITVDLQVKVVLDDGTVIWATLTE